MRKDNCSAPEACRTLEELFLSWKQAQKLESEISCLENTFPKSGDDVQGDELFQGSFTPDGFLGETERCRAHVLFVAKESHLLDNGTDGSRTEDETAGNHGVKSESDSWKTWSLADCAYLNLNKRGGYRDCDSRRLIGYVRYYQAYLQREIELLQPEYVVLMGDWKLENESREEKSRLSETRKETGEELLDLIRHVLESDGISSEHRIFQTEHPASRIGYEERSLREICGIKRTDAGAD